MRWLLNNVSTPFIALLVIGGGVGVALVLLRLSRRRMADPPEDLGVTGAVLGVIGMVYGIVLAFMIVAVWRNFDLADTEVEQEAAALSALVRNARAFDPEPRAEIERATSRYIHAVVNAEWEAMRHGRESARARTAVDNLADALQRVSPRTDVQATWYGASVSTFDEVVRHRRDRIDAAERELPTPLRILLIGGAFLPLWYLTHLHGRRRHLQTMTVVLMAVLISYSVFLAVVLDLPFSGSLTVSSEPFREGSLAPLAR